MFRAAMHRRKLRIALAVLMYGFFTVGAPCAEFTPLHIPRVSRAPKLSDFLENSPREAETVLTIFRQYEPHDGSPVSRPTAAYLSYDSKNLYVGWICKDDPAEIRARVAPRKQISTDDYVSIQIDTFDDHKHAYVFNVNPYGIQSDSRFTDGIGADLSWEGLWYSEGRITANGYVVLITIPFRTLRFPRAPRQVWNICLVRLIERTSEFSTWPFITQRIPQFVGQFAPIELDDDISPGRNIQLIPYGLYSNDRYLSATNGFLQDNQNNPGLDAKAVLHDALTLDMTLNPDFSEIGSDDPEVEVNQRFEVVYPERRPFFLENASVFATPEELFYSRTIVDPQYGLKLTGSVGRWSLGALATDDRAQGQLLQEGQSGSGDRAVDAVFRAEREFGHQSHAGWFLSDTNLDSTSNRVGSMDLRYLTPNNWALIGQATTTQTYESLTRYLAGPGYVLGLNKSDFHTNFWSTYTDRSPGMAVTLGYLNRTDIRYWETNYGYQWKPPGNQTLLSFGPNVDAVLNYDHEGRLENWAALPNFSVSLNKLTSFALTHGEGYELYKGIGFRERFNALSVSTSWYKWLDLIASYSQGSQPDYYPPAGVSPFLGKGNDASAAVTLYPGAHLRLDEIYYYTRLASAPDWLPSSELPNGVVFTNHLIRSKINYQFTRSYSFNAIFDYDSLLPNNALVVNPYAKQADTTLLFTYLPHAGTAFYLGYTDTFQNEDYNTNATPAYTLTGIPGTSTDRQVFVKVNYLLRF